MKKLFAALVLTACTFAASTGGALAADYDYDDYRPAARQGYNSQRYDYNDQQHLARDAAQVRHEQAELEAAQHKARWAWAHGDYWTAKKAQHEIHEERAELESARNHYNAQRRDVVEDTGDDYGHHRHHRRWWWYR